MSQEFDETKIIEKGVPNHVAIILDGNGRWAKKRFLPRTMGHRKGAFNIRDIARYANKIGIKYLTVYCFSTENWKRPQQEVDYLMQHPVRFLKRYMQDLINGSVKITFIGRRDRIPHPLIDTLLEIEEKTKDHKGLQLTLAIDYGSMEEITHAVKNLCKDVVDNKIKIEDINEKLIISNLYTKDMPPVDLLIRTSGEIRISNFLMLQIAYAELYFTDVYWPDFNEKELLKAIDNYQNRNRRFGGLKESK
jgi:undecaprenyl diphosphate synthase